MKRDEKRRNESGTDRTDGDAGGKGRTDGVVTNGTWEARGEKGPTGIQIHREASYLCDIIFVCCKLSAHRFLKKKVSCPIFN